MSEISNNSYTTKPNVTINSLINNLKRNISNSFSDLMPCKEEALTSLDFLDKEEEKLINLPLGFRRVNSRVYLVSYRSSFEE